MGKIVLEVEVNEKEILGKLAAVREAKRNLNSALMSLENTLTGQYGENRPAAQVKEIPG